MARDWKTWHLAYDDPASALSRRLDEVVGVLSAAVDRAPSGLVRLISLCSGDGRDVTRALAGHRRRHQVTGCLVELDPDLADRAAVNLQPVGSHLIVRCADASIPDSFIDFVPADILMFVGILGNIAISDIECLISAVPTMCRHGATVIWTRHRREPDLTPDIQRCFANAGCEHSTFSSPGPASFAVGSERYHGITTRTAMPAQLFTFRDDLP